MAKPTSEQLAKINLKCKKEMSADDVYVHSFRMLGTGYIPSRFLQFDASLMDIYLANVNNGDVVQIADHSFGGYGDTITLPFGRFFEGQLTQDGGKTQLDGVMFMPKGAKTYIGNYTTDDIDQQIDTGILFDSSVSVTWGFSECSICHNDIRDYEQCRHWPGRYYDIDGGAQRVLCTVIAKPRPVNDNSAMIENSIVCAGAYPDAGVLSSKPPNEPSGKTGKLNLNNIADLKLVNKDAPVFCCLSSTSATFQIESENLRDASELHQLYHEMNKLEELPEGWTKARLSTEHKKLVEQLIDEGHEHILMDSLDGALPEKLKTKSKKGSDQSMAMTDEEKLAYDTAIADCGKFKADLATKDTEVATLTAKVAELTPNAELGKKYREDSVKAALESGVRDQGNGFQTELYTKMFESLSIDEINEFKGKWEASALAKLGVPEGHTRGENLKLPDGGLKMAVDPELYKVGR